MVGLPYFLLFVILAVIRYLLLPLDPAQVTTGHQVVNFVFSIIEALIYTAMVVAWHRVTLLGYAADSGFFRVGLTSREWRFLGYTLLVYLGLVPAAVFFVMSQYGAATVWGVLGLVAFAAFVFVGLRLSMVFPATAADHPTSLKTSWQQTAGHFWSMFAIFLLLALIMFVVFFTVFFILGLIAVALGTVGQIILIVFVIPIGLLAGFIGVSALSYVYRVLSGHPDPLAETV
ncbi:MAG: hypothetical protein K0S54_1019 [Alphaproteobacteria bacterium]|nr:hypothetical protein [Alphaproteobacteria bacterium]